MSQWPARLPTHSWVIGSLSHRGGYKDIKYWAPGGPSIKWGPGKTLWKSKDGRNNGGLVTQPVQIGVYNIKACKRSLALIFKGLYSVVSFTF